MPEDVAIRVSDREIEQLEEILSSYIATSNAATDTYSFAVHLRKLLESRK